MANTAVRSLILSLSLLCLPLSGSANPGSKSPSQSASPADADLVVHEWGTFTSVADHSGQAVRWHPRSGVDALPTFVEHFQGLSKVNLQGTIRMETPVLYFHSSRPTTVSARVGFADGVITEWYPHASHVEPNPQKPLDPAALYHWLEVDGSIEWDAVSVEPGLAAQFPSDGSESRYYAARETSAAPLVVKTASGTLQQEKFLFYRGVSAFHVPVAAQSTGDGKVLVRNLGHAQIPGVILFERRGDRLGYRLAGTLESEVMLDPPELNSTVESVSEDLESVLIEQGLYPDEARAMVATWRNAWFEEGSRVLYIVPRAFVDEVLPLSVRPAPSQTVRVFVGRMELITPATEQAVEKALATHDRRTIQKYGRFLEPILDQLKTENPSLADKLDQELQETYNVPLVASPAD